MKDENTLIYTKDKLKAKIARLERVIELYEEDTIYLLKSLKEAQESQTVVETVDRILKEFNRD